MNKKYISGIVIVIAIGTVAFFLINQNNENATNSSVQSASSTFDGRNSTFTINEKSVTLVNGISETAIENSSAKVTTTYFGNTATGDLNGDGLDDQAFLITQNTGGTGTFFYVVVALKIDTGYKTTNAVLIGDRIAPQSTEIHSDSRELHVNYASRRQDEPMTTQPSEGAVLLLKVTSDGILEGLMK